MLRPPHRRTPPSPLCHTTAATPSLHHRLPLHHLFRHPLHHLLTPVTTSTSLQPSWLPRHPTPTPIHQHQLAATSIYAISTPRPPSPSPQPYARRSHLIVTNHHKAIRAVSDSRNTEKGVFGLAAAVRVSWFKIVQID
ncbi:hypothetical protein Tco_0098978 [Tanacetum coccineum]